MPLIPNTVTLITGATGMAAATATLAAQQGARVFIAALSPDDCEQLASRIRQAGGACEFRAGDLTIAAEADAAVSRCLERFGQIDGLFNAAGISGRRFGDGPLDECTDEGWDATLAANARSTFLVTRAVLHHMLSRPLPDDGCRGAILHMASASALHPEPRHFATHAYAASKGAILSLTLAMAAYYAPHKIRVNAIAPGLVRTPMSRRAQNDPDILAYMRAKQPLAGTLIEAEEIARAAIFLLSDDAKMITARLSAWMPAGA